MKIFIGSSDNGQLDEAKQWVTDKDSNQLLEDLERWAIGKAYEWGECYIFIEIPLPLSEEWSAGQNLPSHNSQVDMLIAFSEGAALCELKANTEAAYVNVERAVTQLRGQRKWIGKLAENNGGEKNIYPFLVLHKMYPSEMDSASRRIISNHSGIEIWPTGAHPKLKGRYSSLGPLYLPESLERRLQGRIGTLNPSQRGFQDFLLSLIVNSKTELKQFADFRRAKYYLSNIVRHGNVRHESWYVSGAREELLNTAMQSFENSRVIELVGPPGVGKSTFAKELAVAGKHPVIEVNVSACSSVQDICRKIHKDLHGDAFELVGEETYIKRLTLEPYLFWIRGYDETSIQAIDEFFRMISCVLRKEGLAAWIIESRSPLPSLSTYSLHLPALDDQCISQILDKVEPGGAFNDPESVILRAQGNPGRAIMMWRSKNMDQARDSNEVSWFIRQLKKEENRILPALCLAAKQSPLGVTVDTLTKVVRKLGLGLLDVQIDASIASLMDNLEKCQLADITRFRPDAFGSLLHEILPPGISLTIINHVSARLITHALASIESEKRNRIESAVEEVFYNFTYKDTLSYVTLALNSGDLEPFFRSSFRYTSLGAILSWIDDTGWEPHDFTQDYLLKALRALSGMRRDSGTDASTLGAPDPNDEVQRFASNFVKARAFTVRKTNWTRLAPFLNQVARVPDQDLSAAIYVSLTNRLQNSDKPEEAWAILCDLPEKYPTGSTAKGLAMHRKLEFLNSSKDRQRVLNDVQAYSIITNLARALISEGLRVENLQTICEGLFHYVRAQEMRTARTSFSEVLQYCDALKFFEDAPQTRARQRLRILLTQGSIHRHYCRNEDLQPEDFLEHFAEGMERYIRAFRSARAQRHTLHMLNAASYMTSFCLTSLRYKSEAQVAQAILNFSDEVIDSIVSVERDLAEAELWEREAVIFSNIQRSYPILLYVYLILSTKVNLVGEVRDRFKHCVGAITEEVDRGYIPEERTQSKKNIEYWLRSANRALEFCHLFNRAQNAFLFASVELALQEILYATKKTAVKGRIHKEWRKLASTVNGFET